MSLHLSSHREALSHVERPEYYIKKDMVKEFTNVGIHDKVDVSTIDMDSKSMVITFNLSDNRSVEALVSKYWWCEYTYIDAYCRVVNSLVHSENFFTLPLSQKFPTNFSAHSAVNIDTNDKLDIWRVLIHAIMSNIDELFEEKDGILISKSVDVSSLGLFSTFVAGHFKRVRYGKGRRKIRTVYVKGYWR